jgi:predicted nucleotidyltransferase
MNKAMLEKLSQYFHSQPIEKAWIFGSYARSEEDSNSDIDILVNFVPGETITLFQYIHIVNELQALTGKNIDLVESGQLKKFAEGSVENEKVLIYERKTKMIQSNGVT